MQTVCTDGISCGGKLSLQAKQNPNLKDITSNYIFKQLKLSDTKGFPN